MNHNQILSLLGLALRGGHLVLGEEPVESAAHARAIRLLLLASDAAENTLRRGQHFARMGECLWLRVPFTKAELGQAFGRSSVAMAGVTDLGLAAAAVHRLAEEDPAQYEEAAARLDLKAKRAAERRAERLAHKKNAPPKRRTEPKPDLHQPPKPAERSGSSGRKPAGKSGPRPGKPFRSGRSSSRPSRERHPQSPRERYAHSRPVKKGKGSFRNKAH